jgi:HAD superfamily hydrolase (TIGR01509 family)
MRYPTVIFDVDGTLVDSNDAHAHAWVEALAEFGRSVEFSRVRPLIGKGGDKLLPEVTGIDPESEEGKKISDRRGRILLDRYVPRLKPTRGARSLLEHLRADRRTLYVATSAKRDELEPLLEIAGAADLIEESTSSDDAENSKPDPDIVSAALRESGADRADAIMIGDTPYDVEAARRAGIDIIAFRSGGWDDRGLDGAIAVYDDPQDLLDQYDRSPFNVQRSTFEQRSIFNAP